MASLAFSHSSPAVERELEFTNSRMRGIRSVRGTTRLCPPLIPTILLIREFEPSGRWAQNGRDDGRTGMERPCRVSLSIGAIQMATPFLSTH